MEFSKYLLFHLSMSAGNAIACVGRLRWQRCLEAEKDSGGEKGWQGDVMSHWRYVAVPSGLFSTRPSGERGRGIPGSVRTPFPSYQYGNILLVLCMLVLVSLLPTASWRYAKQPGY